MRHRKLLKVSITLTVLAIIACLSIKIFYGNNFMGNLMNRERPFVLNEGDRNSFSGYVFVDGTYQYVYDDTYAGSNIAFTVDESENYKLPFRNPDDNTSGGIINNFNFGNFEQAEEMLKTKCSQSGKAKIAIEDMNAENSEGAAFTRLSKVFKLIPDNKNCSYPNANNQ